QQIVRRPEIAGRLVIEQDAVVLGAVEGDVGRQLQRLVLAANAIEASDVPVEAVGRAKVARLDLVLLGMQVFLAPRPERDVFGELESAVNAVQRRQRTGKQETNPERRASAELQVLVQNVGRVGEEIGPQVFAARAA